MGLGDVICSAQDKFKKQTTVILFLVIQFAQDITGM